jgi:hypothetical protein
VLSDAGATALGGAKQKVFAVQTSASVTAASSGVIVASNGGHGFMVSLMLRAFGLSKAETPN